MVLFVFMNNSFLNGQVAKAPNASTSTPVYYPNAIAPEYVFDDFNVITGNGGAGVSGPAAFYDVTGTLFAAQMRTYGFGPNPSLKNIRVGLSTNPGWITSKTLKSLNIYSENIKLTFKIKQFNGQPLKVKVVIGMADAAGVIVESTAAHVYTINETTGTSFFKDIAIEIPRTVTQDMSIQIKDNGTGFVSEGVRSLQTFDIDDFKISNESLTTYVNGDWTNGIPTENKDATVLENYNKTIIAKSLRVDGGAVLVVPSGSYHDIYGPLNVTSGNIIYEHGAYLKQPITTNTGNVSFKRNSKPMYRIDLNTWSSPVEGQNLRAFSPKTAADRIYEYNTFDDTWYALDDTYDFPIGIGVGIRSPNNFPTWSVEKPTKPLIYSGVFTGVPNSAEYANEVFGVGQSPNGFNLVGNPYGAPLDLTKLYEANLLINQTNILSVHFWTHTVPNVLNWGDNWQQMNQSGASVPYLNNFIDVGAAFFMKVTSPIAALTISPSMTTLTPTDPPIYHRTAQVGKSRIWLSLNDANYKLNSFMVGYIDGATDGFDPFYDSKKQHSNASGLYSVIDSDLFTIQGKANPFVDTDRVPLHLSVKSLDKNNKQPQELFIQLEGADGLFEQGQTIYLRDNVENRVHNLSENGIYHFTEAIGEYANRFEITYTNKVLGSQDQTQPKVFEVYTNGNELNVTLFSNDLIKNIKLYDIIGNLVFHKEGINNKNFSTRLNKNVYILKMETKNGNVYTKKIIIQ